jgi:hypothetical protein
MKSKLRGCSCFEVQVVMAQTQERQELNYTVTLFPLEQQNFSLVLDPSSKGCQQYYAQQGIKRWGII